MQQNHAVPNDIFAIEESSGCNIFADVGNDPLYIMDGHDRQRRCDTGKFNRALSDLVKKYGYIKELKHIDTYTKTTRYSERSYDYTYTTRSVYKVSLTPSDASPIPPTS